MVKMGENASESPVFSKEQVEKMVDKALTKDPFVKFMVTKLREAGCYVDRDFIRVQHCTKEVGAGFKPPEGVIICHNKVRIQTEVNQALVHELIHAYDYCRGANLDFTNCEHHACTEIRAAALSGDCDYKMELMRGNVRLGGQYQRCVKRRAQISVEMNPHCQGEGVGKAAVEAAFDKCFEDTTPFDRRP